MKMPGQGQISLKRLLVGATLLVAAFCAPPVRAAVEAPQIRPIARDQADAQPATARFQSQVFPDNPLVLEGLDALYLSSEVAADLRSSQINALLGWVNAGGHLIVGVEQVSDITAAAWL